MIVLAKARELLGGEFESRMKAEMMLEETPKADMVMLITTCMMISSLQILTQSRHKQTQLSHSSS